MSKCEGVKNGFTDLKLCMYDTLTHFYEFPKNALDRGWHVSRIIVGHIEFKLQRYFHYFVACLIQEWNQHTTKRQYLLLLLNVEFKLQQYFATCLIREWRSNKNMALLRYTRSIGHASIVMLLVHMHFITKVVAAYRASSLIKSWWANNISHAACSSVYAPYNPRMAYSRSTLHEILDFQKLHMIINCRMRDIVRPWHQAMLDAPYGDF